MLYAKGNVRYAEKENGHSYIDILKKDLRKLDNVVTLVIDAHSCLPYLREEVSKIGYQIAEERIIKEEK